MKKLFILALLTLSLAACGGNKNSEINLSGEMTVYYGKNIPLQTSYSIELPQECENTTSELSELSAYYEGCNVTVVSMPADQATLCEDKEQFTQVMDAMGYNLTVTDYDTYPTDGMNAYRADYELEKTKITQITYVDGGIAYVATYGRPETVDKTTDKIFIKGIEAFRLEEE